MTLQHFEIVIVFNVDPKQKRSYYDFPLQKDIYIRAPSIRELFRARLSRTIDIRKPARNVQKLAKMRMTLKLRH
jgi:hypothetical protein